MRKKYIIISNENKYLLLHRIGPMEVDPNVIAQLYSQLVPDLENSDDSASDEEEDAFNWEWEAVSHNSF